MNGNRILVGENKDKESLWVATDDIIALQNNEVTLSSCSGKFPVSHIDSDNCLSSDLVWSEWSQCKRYTPYGNLIKKRTRNCLNEIRSEQETCIFNIWHGETDIADYTVGSINDFNKHWWKPEMMFDEPPKPIDYLAEDSLTIWNAKNCNSFDCSITITFKVKLFQSICTLEKKTFFNFRLKLISII